MTIIFLLEHPLGIYELLNRVRKLNFSKKFHSYFAITWRRERRERQRKKRKRKKRKKRRGRKRKKTLIFQNKNLISHCELDDRWDRPVVVEKSVSHPYASDEETYLLDVEELEDRETAYKSRKQI